MARSFSRLPLLKVGDLDPSLAFGWRMAGSECPTSQIQTEFTRADLERRNIEEQTKRHVENGRNALDIYVKNHALFDSDNPNAGLHIKMLSVIADNDDLRKLLDQFFNARVSKRSEEAAPAESLRGLPDRISPQAAAAYQFTSFLIYTQALASEAQRAGIVLSALTSSGVKVAPLDTRIKSAPQMNEIRYYRSVHKEIADKLANGLQEKTRESFQTKLLNVSDLPDGVMELWVSGPRP